MVDEILLGLFVYIITVGVGSFFLIHGRFLYYLKHGKISKEELERFVAIELHPPIRKLKIAQDYNVPKSYIGSIMLIIFGSIIALPGLQSFWYALIIDHEAYLLNDLCWTVLGTLTFIRAWFFGYRLLNFKSEHSL